MLPIVQCFCQALPRFALAYTIAGRAGAQFLRQGKDNMTAIGAVLWMLGVIGIVIDKAAIVALESHSNISPVMCK